MCLKWTDVQSIAIELAERYPDVNPLNVNFVTLRQWVMELPTFDDNPDYCGERVLEAIQSHWIEEVD